MIRKRRLTLFLATGFMLAGVTFIGQPGITANNPKYQGITLTAVFPGAHMAEFFYDFVPEWEKQTGAKVNVIALPYGECYAKVTTELIGATGAYDILGTVLSWPGSWIAGGYLAPIDKYIDKDSFFWKDIVPAARAYASWGEKTYGFIYDLDFHSMWYNKDFFEDPKEQAAFKAKYGYELRPPQTWNEWRDVGEFFTRDIDGDGKIDLWGLNECPYPPYQGWWYADRFVTYGVDYFDKDMNPLVPRDAAIEALQNMVNCIKFANPQVFELAVYENYDLLFRKKTVMMNQWPCAGKRGNDLELSDIIGSLGHALIPGTKERRRTLLAGGHALYISSATKGKKLEAAVDLCKFTTGPEVSAKFVVDPASGNDPYRYSHYTLKEFYKMWPTPEEGEKVLQDFLKAAEQAYPDLMIPGAMDYYESLSRNMVNALVGKVTAEKAVDAIQREWNDITTRYGVTKQKKAWLQQVASWEALGLPILSD